MAFSGSKTVKQQPAGIENRPVGIIHFQITLNILGPLLRLLQYRKSNIEGCAVDGKRIYPKLTFFTRASKKRGGKTTAGNKESERRCYNSAR